jgi:hypothetical protein
LEERMMEPHSVDPPRRIPWWPFAVAVAAGVLVVGVLLGLPAAGVSVPWAAGPTADLCPPDEAQAYVDRSLEVLDLSDHFNRQARSTSRIALSFAVGKLQELRATWSAVESPPCAQDYHLALLAYMDEIIAGYQTFMAGGADADVLAHFGEADAALASARDHLQRLAERIGQHDP